MAVIVCFLLVNVALAQDVPPPSEQTFLHNACLEGGFFEGKCDWPTEVETEWAWACGFYYALYQRGEISLVQAPDWCKFVAFVPFVFTPTPEEPVFELCIVAGDEMFPFSYFVTGEPGQPGNAAIYPESNSCEGLTYTQPIYVDFTCRRTGLWGSELSRNGL